MAFEKGSTSRWNLVLAIVALVLGYAVSGDLLYHSVIGLDASAFPAGEWIQKNLTPSASNAMGGLVVAFPTVNAGGGTVTNYYKDDSAIDPNDTGDQRSYADSGLFIDSPGAVIDFSLVTFILPPNSATNVGAGYFDRISNPLTTTTTTQIFGQGELIFMPAILKP